jgi:hypothetical protein
VAAARASELHLRQVPRAPGAMACTNEAVPGNIRRAEHSVAFLITLVEYLKVGSAAVVALFAQSVPVIPYPYPCGGPL